SRMTAPHRAAEVGPRNSADLEPRVAPLLLEHLELLRSDLALHRAAEGVEVALGLLLLALQHEHHRAVGLVANPARHRERPRQVLRRGAKADALHHPSKRHLVSHALSVPATPRRPRRPSPQPRCFSRVRETRSSPAANLHCARYVVPARRAARPESPRCTDRPSEFWVHSALSPCAPARRTPSRSTWGLSTPAASS